MNDAPLPPLSSAPERPCWCFACNVDKLEPLTGLSVTLYRMILCPLCGNKRCPHAASHLQACTNSNEPGQPGSLY